MYKPERDNLAAMSAAASYVPNGAAAPPPPAFEGAGPSAAPAPKREPPGAVPQPVPPPDVPPPPLPPKCNALRPSEGFLNLNPNHSLRSSRRRDLLHRSLLLLRR